MTAMPDRLTSCEASIDNAAHQPGAELPLQLCSRRTVLRGALAAVIAGSAGALLAACGDDDGEAGSIGGSGEAEGSNDSTGTDNSAESLRPTVASDDAIVALGERYRELYPDADDVDLLQSELGLSAESLADADSETWLAIQFAERVQADYANDAIQLIDGWLLSKTELQAAALLSLL